MERKIGTSAFSAMTINATKWFDANWASSKGLYSEVFETTKKYISSEDLLSYGGPGGTPKGICLQGFVLNRNFSSYNDVLPTGFAFTWSFC